MARIDREILSQLTRGGTSLVDTYRGDVEILTREDEAFLVDRENLVRKLMRRGLNSLPIEERILAQSTLNQRAGETASRFVLNLLDTYGPQTPSEILELCESVQGVDAEFLRQLETDGLVEPDEACGRDGAVKLKLSAAGTEELDRLMERQNALAERILSPLDDDEKQELLRLLTKIVNHG